MSQTTPPNARGIAGFHHVAIRVRDFDRSVAFYTDVLGFSTRVAWGEAPKRAVMLDVGSGDYLEVFERPDQAPPPEQEGVILHLALRTNDTDGVLERARAAGCTVTVEPKTVNIPNTCPATASPLPVRLAFIKGPDGEIVEFFQNDLT